MSVAKRTTIVLSGMFVMMLLIATVGASPDRTGPKKPRDVIVTGRIVDLHSYVTGKFAMRDPVRSTRACIQAGVPAALEVDDGLIVVGQGAQGPRRTLVKLSYQTVELKGRLYQRGGLRYIDVSEAKLAKKAEEPDEEEQEDADVVEPEESDEPEPVEQGACCLAGGDCLDTDEEECDLSGGQFHQGATCDEIECEPWSG